MPRQSLDAPENLPKEAARQVAFGQLQDEEPGVPDQAPASLEKPLLQARQRPVLDGPGEGESAQEIPEVVGDDPEEQAHLVGPEAVAGETRPVGGFLACLDPLLCRPPLVVEMDDRPVRPSQIGDDEAHTGKEFPEVVLDLGNDPSGPVPGRGLILEAPGADERGVARAAAGPRP